MKIGSLHYISQETNEKTHQKLIQEACEAGVKWVQLRMKEKAYEEALLIAKEVKAICLEYQATLIVNDYVGIAKEIKADGVHLGKLDMNPQKAREILGDGFIIGGTANTIEDIRLLTLAKVNYIGLGPYRFTSTKENLSPILGMEGFENLLKQWKSGKIEIPIIAIGGIVAEDIEALKELGVYGVAVGASINKAIDKKEMVEWLNSKVNGTESSFVK